MTSTNDLDLLAEFIRNQSQDAFTALVKRHLNLVYCAALRQVRSPQLAEDVAQSVFTDLARNAARLKPDTILTAWLYQVTRRTAIDIVQKEARRQLREQIAFEMNAMNATTDDWTQIEPLLDEAMHALDDTDRTAVLLRYFENKSLREVGHTLGTTDDTARKRVNRAIEHLREFFAKHGVTVGGSGLIVVISANAVQAAPVGLSVTILTTAALAGTTTVTTATATVTKAIAMTTLQKTLFTTVLAAAVGFGIYEARQVSVLRSQVQTLPPQQQTEQILQLHQERDEALSKLTAARAEMGQLRQDAAEILKLRAEVTRLRAEAQLMTQLKSNSSGDPVESAAKIWVNRVARLKQRLEQVPEARIPEMQFLDEEDWLAVVKGRPLDTDTDYRRALGALRSAGEGKLASLMQKALRGFTRSNNGQFPTDLAQLQPYFDSPVDAEILDRWKIAPGQTVPSVGVGEVIITQKAPPVDEVFDTRHVLGSGGGQGSTDFLSPETWAAMKPVYEAYRAAHNGQSQTDFSELQPYARTPEQQAAFQKIILRNSGSK